MIRTLRGLNVMVEILHVGKVTMLNQYFYKVSIVEFKSTCLKRFEQVSL
jgi:hypothetical protein